VTNIWFVSDTHFGHANIIRYCERPFKDVHEMDEVLIKNWNERVKPGDLVYHLGDFALSAPAEVPNYVRRLNGTIQLIHGNHDRFLKQKRNDNYGFNWIGPYKEIKIDGQLIVLCHYPFLTWRSSHRGSWALHGHCHGNLKRDMAARRLDIGVDCWNYKPISLEEVAEEMKKVEFKAVDHHDL